MSGFTCPVIMKITIDQFYNDLKEPLQELGYIFRSLSTNWKLNCYLGTNLGFKCNIASNFNNYIGGNRYYINHYNKELFLALAALNQDSQKGEWFEYIRETTTAFIKGKLYKCNKNSSYDKYAFESETSGHGWNIMYECNSDWIGFKKATKEELIEYFSKEKKEEKQENKEMKKIIIPIQFLHLAFEAMNESQKRLTRANVDAFTGETTEEFIKEYYEKECCVNWRAKMENEFSFLKSKDINVQDIHSDDLFDKQSDSKFITIARYGDSRHKAFYLNSKYNWKLTKDYYLIPTRK